jgi:hypothetical protein
MSNLMKELQGVAAVSAIEDIFYSVEGKQAKEKDKFVYGLCHLFLRPWLRPPFRWADSFLVLVMIVAAVSLARLMTFPSL